MEELSQNIVIEESKRFSQEFDFTLNNFQNLQRLVDLSDITPENYISLLDEERSRLQNNKQDREKMGDVVYRELMDEYGEVLDLVQEVRKSIEGDKTYSLEDFNDSLAELQDMRNVMLGQVGIALGQNALTDINTKILLIEDKYQAGEIDEDFASKHIKKLQNSMSDLDLSKQEGMFNHVYTTRVLDEYLRTYNTDFEIDDAADLDATLSERTIMRMKYSNEEMKFLTSELANFDISIDTKYVGASISELYNQLNIISTNMKKNPPDVIEMKPMVQKLQTKAKETKKLVEDFNKKKQEMIERIRRLMEQVKKRVEENKRRIRAMVDIETMARCEKRNKQIEMLGTIYTSEAKTISGDIAENLKDAIISGVEFDQNNVNNLAIKLPRPTTAAVEEVMTSMDDEHEIVKEANAENANSNIQTSELMEIKSQVATDEENIDPQLLQEMLKNQTGDTKEAFLSYLKTQELLNSNE